MPERLAAALERQEELVEEVHKLRASNRLLATIVSLLVIVVVLLGGLAVYARDVAREARTAVHASCESRQQARVDNRGLWTDLIDVLDPGRASPKTVEFERRMNERLQPIDC